MRANTVLKSAILAALTILSSVPALAGDFRTKERLPKTALGGESGGGGQVRIGYYSANELMKILEGQLKNDDPDNVSTDTVIDKNLALITKEDKSEDEIESLKMQTFKTEKMADGRYLITPAYDDIEVDFFEITQIKNPLLKSVLTKMMKKQRVDYNFVRKYEKEFKYAFERANPGVKFDKEVYRYLVIEVRAMNLDFVLMQAPGKIHLQKAPCKDIDGKSAPSAVTKFERLTPICFSASMLAQIPQRLIESELVGLYFHELAHQHEIGEKGAEILQQFIVDEVVSGRMELRSFGKTLRSRIDSTMEYAGEFAAAYRESKDLDLKYFIEDVRAELAQMRTLAEKALMFNERDATLKTIKVLDATLDKLKKAEKIEEQVVLINELWAQSYEYSASIPVRY